MIDYLLLGAAIVGLIAGGVLVARSPTFWFGLALVIFNAVKPYLWRFFVKLLKPYDPATQNKLDESRRRGEDCDYFKKRPRQR